MEQWPKPSIDKKINDPEAAERLRKEVRAKLEAGTLVPKKQEGDAKVETLEEKAARRAEFAARSAGKTFEQLQTERTQTELMQDRREGRDSKAA